jgi:hypothetical protein
MPFKTPSGLLLAACASLLAGPVVAAPSYKISFQRPAVHIGYDVTQGTPFEHDASFLIPATSGTCTFSGRAFAYPGHVGVHNLMEMLWTSTVSGSSSYDVITHASATDFVITGPAASQVAGELHFRLRGALTRAGGYANNSSHGTRLIVTVGAKFGQLTLLGDLTSTNFDTHGTGILAGITDPNLDFAFGLPGTYPVGTAFDVGLNLTGRGFVFGNSLISPNPGSVSTDADDTGEGLFLEEVNGQVLALPAGYTLNSTSWGIVNNHFQDVVGVEPSPEQNPLRLSLSPNPSWDAVTLSFAQPLAGDARIQVFDVAGKLVRTLTDEWIPAGARQLRWDGRSDTGWIAPAGVYVVRMESERGRLTKRLVRLR